MYGCAAYCPNNLCLLSQLTWWWLYHLAAASLPNLGTANHQENKVLAKPRHLSQPSLISGLNKIAAQEVLVKACCSSNSSALHSQLYLAMNHDVLLSHEYGSRQSMQEQSIIIYHLSFLQKHDRYILRWRMIMYAQDQGWSGSDFFDVQGVGGWQACSQPPYMSIRLRPLGQVLPFGGWEDYLICIETG